MFLPLDVLFLEMQLSDQSVKNKIKLELQSIFIIIFNEAD